MPPPLPPKGFAVQSLNLKLSVNVHTQVSASAVVGSNSELGKHTIKDWDNLEAQSSEFPIQATLDVVVLRGLQQTSSGHPWSEREQCGGGEGRPGCVNGSPRESREERIAT